AADAAGHLLRDLAAQTDDAGFGGSFGLSVERGRRSAAGRATPARGYIGVEVAVLDAAGGAGAGDELELDAEVAGAVAHGGGGEGALVAGREGARRFRPSTAFGGPPPRFTGRRRGGGDFRLLPGRACGWGGGPRSSGGAGGRSTGCDVALALDSEADQRAADGELLTRL